jgi:hypothetical protein
MKEIPACGSEVFARRAARWWRRKRHVGRSMIGKELQLRVGDIFGLRVLRARLLPRPLKRIFRRMSRSRDLRSASVLELFARGGDWHTIEYSWQVGKLELWEIDPSYAPKLRRRFPGATVRTVDSYEALRSNPRTFDVVIGDAPIGEHGGHHEHFDLFPAVFSWLKDSSFLIIDVVPVFDQRTRGAFPNAFGSAHLAARKAFYRCERPDRIPMEHMIQRYRAICDEAGWTVHDVAVEKRLPGPMHYMMLTLHRKAAARPIAEEAASDSRSGRSEGVEQRRRETARRRIPAEQLGLGARPMPGRASKSMSPRSTSRPARAAIKACGNAFPSIRARLLRRSIFL